MRPVVKVVAAWLAVVAGLVACASFASAPNDPATSGEAGADATDAGASDVGDVGTPRTGDPVIRGFSKASGVGIARPPNTVVGDLLILVVEERGSTIDPSSFAGDAGASAIGHCSNLNQQRLYYATRIDDGAPTYTLVTGPAPDSFTAVLVAVENAGTPDDFALTNQDAVQDASGSASPVTVQHDQDLVLVAFGVESFGTFGPDSGVLSLVTSANGGLSALQLYKGTFRRGQTPAFGPFTADPVCWATLTVAIPPR